MLLAHLAMMLATANGWALPSDDEAHDSPLPPHDDSGITGEVDGGRARRQLAWACTSSWSACPRRARSCPHPLTRGLLARSDDWCDDHCHWSSCDYSCDSSCDGFFGGSCDSGCDGCDHRSCNSGCDNGCDAGCTSGCSSCPSGTISAASTSLVWPPRAVCRGRAAPNLPTSEHRAPAHTATMMSHTRAPSPTQQQPTPCTERVRAQARGRSPAILTAIPRRACRWIGDASLAPS